MGLILNYYFIKPTLVPHHDSVLRKSSFFLMGLVYTHNWTA
jgi:hypothetical protein